MGSLYRSKHELIFVYRVGAAPHFNMVELGKHGRNRTNVWDYASVNSFVGSRREDLTLHPTVTPLRSSRTRFKTSRSVGILSSISSLALAQRWWLLSAAGDAFQGSISTPPMSTLQSSAGR
jgi:hypothetical protein